MREEKLDWKKIPISKEVNPREVIDKRKMGSQYGKRWSLRNNAAYSKSMFADGLNKK